MFGLKRIVFLTLLPLPLLADHVLAGDFSPSVEVQENITILKETKKCPQCDLSGANLSRFDLSGANLKGANLSRSKMALTNLSGANLQNADLREAIFTGADLANTDMRGADLTGSSFAGAYMVGALMDGEMLSTTPYAKDQISDVEESVYVEDTVRSKKPQKTDELIIGTRRDFEETPPAVPVVNIDEKPILAPKVNTPVENVTLAYDDASENMLPNQSAAAPDAKIAPAIQEVRLQEDVVAADSLPVINETKKEASPVAISEAVLVETETAANDTKVDEAFEQESIVIAPGTVSPSEETQDKIEISEETDVTLENVLSGEEQEAIAKAQSVAVKQEVVVPDENETIVKDTTQSFVESENETVTESSENTEVITEESPGIMQTVINMISSTEPSTEVLKNAALLLDSKQCYGCNLQGVNLSGENLDGVDLEGADLSNAILKDVDFEEANLKGTNLSGADLSGADLSEADLYKANLSGANLTGTNLEKALLDEVNFTGVIGYNNSTILLLDAN